MCVTGTVPSTLFCLEAAVLAQEPLPLRVKRVKTRVRGTVLKKEDMPCQS